ncbi:MAG: hypothetical protein MR294_09525 [Bacteroidales bacterium]|nr:hypothetical protein [Bacteroidales bacterium]
MKKIAILLCLTMLFCSCEKKNITECHIKADADAEAFEQMLYSLDDLNASYGYLETRGGGKPYVVSASDAAGAAIGRWIGKRLGAGLGIVTGNPVVGVVGYAAGMRFGGWAGSVGASALAEKYYNPSISTAPDISGNFVPDTLQYAESVDCSYEDFTFGDLHNYCLYHLIDNGNTYISTDDTIRMEELFSDLQSLSEITGFEDPVILDEEGKTIMADFYVQLVAVLSWAASNNEDPDITMNKIQQIMENLGMPTQEVSMYISVISMLTACVSTMDSEGIKAYEKDYINLVRNSQLSDDMKDDLVDIGSVAIMSTAFWTK